jgi:hypothetical protein
MSSPLMFAAPQIPKFAHQDELNKLVEVWSRKRPRNILRQAYLDSRVLVKNLDISVSDEIADLLDMVCGWPEKAVYSLANLCQWDGVTAPGGSDDPFELSEILRANRFDVEVEQAIASEMTHSCVFVSTTLGDESAGEPPVVVMPHSAEWATALWDRRTRSVSFAMTIDEVDDYGRPTRLTMLTRDAVIELRDVGDGWVQSSVVDHQLKRVPMEVLPFRPALDRPFGRSRISRPVMNITDRAIRSMLRGDVADELFTTPGLLLRGITKEAFDDLSKSWTWKMAAIKGVSRDEEGLVPEVTALPQQSSQPFTERMRALAAEFSGVTSIPISQLGIVQDNPSSAEAIYAAKEELVIEAQNANRVNGYALNRVYQNVVMLRDGLVEVPEELAGLSTKWRNPSMPSVVSQSDAMVKQISAIPDLALTDVALEELGYTDEQIRRIRSQIRASGAADRVRDVLAAVRKPQEVEARGESDGGESVQGGQQSDRDAGDSGSGEPVRVA